MNTDPKALPCAAAQLPPYRALLVVDMKDFSGSLGRHHAELTAGIPDVLCQAFHRGGLSHLWDGIRFQGSTGDGYYLGFLAEMLPFLLNPLLPALQDELQYRNKVGPLTGHDQPLRMRASIHVGPMTDSGHNIPSDGSGTARIETHRLLDAEPVRELLARSSTITCVAAIVSSRAFEDAVLSGYADDDPELYVPAPVRIKTYSGRGYLRVPRPSGGLLTHGFGIPGDEDHTATLKAQDSRGRRRTTPREDSSDSEDQADRDSRRSYTAIRTFVNGAEGPINTGSGPQNNHMPPGAGRRSGRTRRRKEDPGDLH